MMRRVFAISDLHVDYPSNMEFVKSWRADDYGDDILIIAGDVTDNVNKLRETLQHLTNSFYKVLFCPGNHELWIRSKENEVDSISKFHNILSLCQSLGVSIEAEKFHLSEEDPTNCVWIVPLFSWYSKPDEDAADSLYYDDMEIPVSSSNEEHSMWMDDYLCKWHSLEDGTKSQYFASLNSSALEREYDAPVISFSHFLPRQDLIASTKEEVAALNKERSELGFSEIKFLDPKKSQAYYNFSCYAGCNVLDQQIRQLGSKIHIYGHQHHNKNRVVDGVRYISHCVGNEQQRKNGMMYGLAKWNGPRLIWHPSTGDSVCEQ